MVLKRIKVYFSYICIKTAIIRCYIKVPMHKMVYFANPKIYSACEKFEQAKFFNNYNILTASATEARIEQLQTMK